MPLKNKLIKIAELQAKIDSYGPLSPELKNKIDYRFRLDWNYHSNAIEGGTLSKEETRTVMVGLAEIHGKPIRDIIEMKGHDAVVMDILRLGKGIIRLSERRLKDIHKSIIDEEDIDKKGLLGNWKTENNHVINYKMEKFNFAPANEVPYRIHKLLDNTNAEIDGLESPNKNINPILIALKFHLEYVNIHPFYDGNGRTARIFTNLLLISFGFPPFIVKTNDRDRYNQLLADIQCYGGNPDLFFEFLCELIVRSQELVLDAIDGKDISDENDFEKELALIDQELSDFREAKVRISNDVIISLFENSFKPLFIQIESRLSALDLRFNQKSIHYKIDPIIQLEEIDKMNTTMSGLENQIYFNYQEPEKYGHHLNKSYPIKNLDVKRSLIRNISVQFSWLGFKKAGTKAFDLYASLGIYFEEFRYSVRYPFPSNEIIVEKLYDEPLRGTDLKEIIKRIEKDVLDRLKSQINKITADENEKRKSGNDEQK